MATNKDRPKVYRLQGLPGWPDFDRLAAAQFVASVIDDPTLKANDIYIYSLATAIEPHRRWNRKVATVMFKHTPSAITTADGTDGPVISEWRFPVQGQNEPLVIDSHFLGLTVLNDVNMADHRSDCIAMSGLASHPFGSWQPKGDDKSYMWIRDTLPTIIDGVRFILYGYDTTLKNSNSFQTIVDLSNTLYLTLQTNGWASPSTKPLIFLAHSLGGVLLKQLLVILAGANDSAQFMLGMIKGAIFFGTPSRGMAMGQLLNMVGDQPNRNLVKHLSKKSKFLPSLETQFSGISHIQRMKLYWAYETKTSPTVQLVNGTYKRSGPRSIMVDHQSATGSRRLDPSFSIQIDEDHSDMVKFNRDDRRIPTIINKIQEMCSSAGASHGLDFNLPAMSVGPDSQYDSDSGSREQNLLKDARDPESIGWDYDLITSLLKAPDRDQRYEQIDQNFGHSFSWAFENPLLGLSQWLREGEGIFWVNGKPGSGKSTFMKFLLNDDRTKELLHHWRSKPNQIIASFFFHHRGTHLQKSFEGLLMSLLSQILEGDSRLHRIVGEFCDEKASDIFETVQSDINAFFQRCKINSTSTEFRRRIANLLSENPCLQLHSILEGNEHFVKPENRLLIKETLLHDFESLSRAANDEVDNNIPADSTCRKLSAHLPEHKETIKSMIETWCKSLDITSRIEDLWREARLQTLDRFHKQHIRNLARRQRVRQQRLIDIQLNRWTRYDLEEGLRRVFNQKLFELELCLFFDALDEYVGSPEVISAFLKDLIKVMPLSKTRTKILFSSRPWTVFHDRFGTCPSLSIHEHTMEDIQDYCAGCLPVCRRTRSLIHPLVGEIANRARGVFVWVKLVMSDLTELAKAIDKSDKGLSQKLRQCLESLPDELEDYYSTIIHRLPASTRKQSYILLECLSRSSDTICLSDVQILLACGMYNSLQEVKDAVDSGKAPGSTGSENHVRTLSGGIIDILDFQSRDRRNRRDFSLAGGYRCQLMHQTVKDWVESPTFKHTVLGPRADTTFENGHSFLVKYYVYRSMSESISRHRIFDHALKAEMSTGVSQYRFLSQLPSPVLAGQLSHVAERSEIRHETLTPHFPPSIKDLDIFWLSSASTSDITGETHEMEIPPRYLGDRSGRVEKNHMLIDPSISWLHLAAYSGLSLYLADYVQHDRLVFRGSNEPLVSALLEPVRYKSAVQHSDIVPGRLESAKLILDNRFRTLVDPDALPLIFEGIWKSPDRETVRLYVDLALTAAQGKLPLTTCFDTDLDPGGPTSLLHVSPPMLAEYLLAEGVDPDMLNGAGQTPLDYILGPNSVFQKDPFGLDCLYEVLKLLISNGAQRRQGTRHSQRLQSQRLLQRLSDNGYDIKPLLSLQKCSSTPDEQLPSIGLLTDAADGRPASPTPSRRRLLRNRFARIFGGSNVSSRR